MLKNFTKVIFLAKAAVDILKEKIDTKAAECALELKKFSEKKNTNSSNTDEKQCNLKDKAKVELLDLINQVNHRAQINELNLKSFIKEKLTELTNNALLDSTELNDIRAEIASLHAEIADIKAQMQPSRR